MTDAALVEWLTTDDWDAVVPQQGPFEDVIQNPDMITPTLYKDNATPVPSAGASPITGQEPLPPLVIPSMEEMEVNSIMPTPLPSTCAYVSENIGLPAAAGNAIMEQATKKRRIDVPMQSGSVIYFSGESRTGIPWQSDHVHIYPGTHISGNMDYPKHAYRSNAYDISNALETVRILHVYLYRLDMLRMEMYTMGTPEKCPVRICGTEKSDSKFWARYEASIIGGMCTIYNKVPKEIVVDTLKTVFSQKQSVDSLSDEKSLMENVHMTLLYELGMGMKKKMYRLLPRKSTSSTYSYMHIMDIALRCGCVGVCDALAESFLPWCHANKRIRMESVLCDCVDVCMEDLFPQSILKRLRHSCITDGIRHYVQSLRYKSWMIQSAYPDTLVTRWAYLRHIIIVRDSSSNIYFVQLLQTYLARMFNNNDTLIMRYLYNVLGFGDNIHGEGCVGITLPVELYNSTPTAVKTAVDARKNIGVLTTPQLTAYTKKPNLAVLVYKLFDLVESNKIGCVTKTDEARYRETELLFATGKVETKISTKIQHWSEMIYTGEEANEIVREKQFQQYHRQAYVCVRKYYRPHNIPALRELLCLFEPCTSHRILLCLHHIYCFINNLNIKDKKSPFYTQIRKYDPN